MQICIFVNIYLILWYNYSCQDNNLVKKQKSVSFIDHFYDKLLRLPYSIVENFIQFSPYLAEIGQVRRKIMIDFILYCSSVYNKSGCITQEQIEKYINK